MGFLSADVRPAASWGLGRAVAAHPLPDDRLAVVTSVGAYTTDLDGGDVTLVSSFAGSTAVTHSAVSRDGSRLAIVANTPAELRWYDLDARQPVGSIPFDLGESVRHVEFVDDDDVVISTSSRVLAVDTSQETPDLTTLRSEPGGLHAIVGGTLVTTADRGNELAVGNSGAVSTVPLDLATDASALDVKASPDGRLAGVTVGAGPNEFDRSDSIAVFDTDDWAPVGVIRFDRPLAPDVWALSGSWVAVSDGPSLELYPTAGGTNVEAVAIADEPIQSVSAIGDGFVTVHRNGAVASWSGPDWAPSVLDAGGLALTGIDVDGTTLTTVDVDGRVAVRDLVDDRDISDERFAVGRATDVAVSADGSRVALSNDAGRVLVFDDRLDEIERYSVDGVSPRVDTVSFNPANGQVVTGLAQRLGDESFDDSVMLWGDSTSTPAVVIGGESEEVSGCAFYYNRIGFTDDGEMSVVSHDFSLSIHDGSTGEYIVGVQPFESTILDTAFSTDAELLVASADDGMVRVWDTDDYDLVAEHRSVPGGLQAFELLSDDESAVATDLTGRLFVLDVYSGAEIMDIADLGRRSTALAVSPDGEVVAAPLSDGSIGLWSTSSGDRLAVFGAHTDTITGIAFAPDGSWLVTASLDGTAQRWDIELA